MVGREQARVKRGHSETAVMRKALKILVVLVVVDGWKEVDDGEELEEEVAVCTDVERAEEKLA